MTLLECFEHIAYWEYGLKTSLRNRHHWSPASAEAAMARRIVRRCVANLRQWEAQADSLFAAENAEMAVSP